MEDGPIYSNSLWNKEEVESYQPLKDPRLDLIYDGIPKTLPQTRAWYLAEVYLGPVLFQIDQDVLMSTANRKGKPAALNMLESLALNYFDGR